MKLLAFLILTIPTDWELFSERKGEAPEHKKTSATVRAFLMIVFSSIALIIISPRYVPWVTSEHLWPLTVTYLKCLALSFAIFVMFFDYLFNIIFHKRTRVWYSYLSKSPLDKAWSGWNWKWRMAVRIVIFVSALTWFLWN